MGNDLFVIIVYYVKSDKSDAGDLRGGKYSDTDGDGTGRL